MCNEDGFFYVDIFCYIQPCNKRQPLGERKSCLLRQVTFYKKVQFI